MDRNDIESMLKSYKENLALLELLQNDCDYTCKAQVLTGMPSSGKVSNPVLDGFERKEEEINSIKKKIQQVNIWLKILTDEERFVIEKTFFEDRFIHHISNTWDRMGNGYFAKNFWINKKRSAILKIIALETKKGHFYI